MGTDECNSPNVINQNVMVEACVTSVTFASVFSREQDHTLDNEDGAGGITYLRRKKKYHSYVNASLNNPLKHS